jgi:uncharacterized protein (TIGR02001 family)
MEHLPGSEGDWILREVYQRLAAPAAKVNVATLHAPDERISGFNNWSCIVLVHKLASWIASGGHFSGQHGLCRHVTDGTALAERRRRKETQHPAAFAVGQPSQLINPLGEKSMKKILLAAALGSAFFAAPHLAMAEEAAAAAPAPNFTANAGIFNDYRFRGYTQTGYKTAYQGGFDYAFGDSGFYVGNWNSNVEQALYNGASLESDLYGGYKGAVGDFAYDIGYIYYYYANSGSQGTTKIKNGEAYIGGTYGPISAKYYYATTNFFSIGEGPSYVPADTKGSGYLVVSATFDLGGGLGVTGHYGYQKIKDGKKANLLKDSVGDYQLGVTYAIADSGWVAGASVVGTSEKNLFTTAESAFTKGAGKTGVVVSVSKTF